MRKQKTEKEKLIAKQNAKMHRNVKAMGRRAIKESNEEHFAQKAILRANELVAAREKYETETLARSNAELYGILSEVLGLFYTTLEENCVAKTVAQMKSVLTERGVRVQGNTPAITVFVRYVFNSDRKRSYNYTCTLMAALQHKIQPENLAEFISGKHGVEECKRTFSMSPETLKKKQAIASAATDVVELLGTMPSAATVKLPDAKTVTFAEGAGYAFVIARKLSNGQLELLRTIPVTTKGMQAAAVKALAKDLIDKKVQVLKNAKAAKEKDTTAFAKASLTVKELQAA